MGDDSKSERLYLVEEFPTLAKTELGARLKHFEVCEKGRGYSFDYLSELEKRAIDPSYQPKFKPQKPTSTAELQAWWRKLTGIKPGN